MNFKIYTFTWCSNIHTTGFLRITTLTVDLSTSARKFKSGKTQKHVKEFELNSHISLGRPKIKTRILGAKHAYVLTYVLLKCIQ